MFIATRAGIGTSKGSKAYRYWRLFSLTNNGATYIAIAEVELRGVIGGADLTTTTTPATASTTNTTNAASNTVDNNIASTAAWLSAAGTTTDQWVRWDMATPTALAQIAIYPRSNALTSAPKDFVIQGSSDGTTFTDVKSFSGVTGWSAAWREFDL